MNFDLNIEDFIPAKIISCNCEQCRSKKNGKNKNLKNRVRRALNKKRRKVCNKYINFYFA